MPTIEEIDQLRALTERLIPLTRVQRGEMIRSEDWNQVVGALIEVARAVLADDREVGVAAHEHTDQVGAGWLAPALRTLMERGPLADPAAVGRVSTLERAINRLTERIDQVDGGIQEVRSRIAAVSANDLRRAADVTAVRRTVDGLEDARDDVLALRGTLRAVEENVRVAVEVGSRLTVNGQPVDVPALVGRVAAVEELRNRLTSPTGELLDAVVFERKLVDLTTKLVTEQELDAALASRPGIVPPEAFAPIEERLRASLTNQVTTSFDRLSGDVRAETSTRIDELAGRTTQAIADALPGLRENVLSATRTDIQAVRDAHAGLISQLAATESTLRTEFGGQIQTLDDGIATRLRTALDQRLEETLAPIRTDIANVGRRAEALSATLTVRETQFRTLETRLNTVEGRFTTIRGEIEAGFNQQLAASLTQVRTDFNTRFESFDRDNRTRLERGLADVRTGVIQEARTAAREEATREVGLAEVRVRDSILANTRGELPMLVNREVEAVRPVLEANVVRTVRERPGG